MDKDVILYRQYVAVMENIESLEKVQRKHDYDKYRRLIAKLNEWVHTLESQIPVEEEEGEKVQ